MKQQHLSKDIFRLEHYQELHERHSYLKGLMVSIYEQPNDDRWSHYAARELLWSGRPKSAIKEFQRQLKMGGWHSERAESLIFMGDAYGQLGNPEDQALSYSLAFYIDSSRREPLMKLAEFYLHNKNYQAAVSYAKAAMEIPWNGFYASNKAFYEHLPHEILYKAYGWLGRIPEAQYHITEALKIQPTNKTYLDDLKYYFGNEDIYVDKGIEGWMSNLELQYLYDTAKKVDQVVEVGSWAGRSTHSLLSGCKGTVTAIDTWAGSKDPQDLTHDWAKQRDMFEVFKQNTAGVGNLKIIRKFGVDAAKDFEDGSIPFFFLDAGHSKDEVDEDIKVWLPKIKKGGIFAGHDYKPDVWMGVVESVNEAFGKPDELHDTIWVHHVK